MASPWVPGAHASSNIKSTTVPEAVAAAPTYAVAHNNLGVLLRDTGDVPEALEAYGECARHSPDHRNAEQNYLLGLNYVLSGERREVCEAHASWGARFAAV